MSRIKSIRAVILVTTLRSLAFISTTAHPIPLLRDLLKSIDVFTTLHREYQKLVASNLRTGSRPINEQKAGPPIASQRSELYEKYDVR